MIGGAKQRGLQLNALESIRRADPSRPNFSVTTQNKGGRPAKPSPFIPAFLQPGGGPQPRPVSLAVPPPPTRNVTNRGQRMAQEQLYRKRWSAFTQRKQNSTGDIL